MTRLVALKDIILDPDVQVRFVLAEDRVRLFESLYREDPERGEPRLPPVTLIETSNGKLILADGFTRVEAASRSGLEFVQASIQPGTKRDAILASIKENAVHGLPLTLAERRRAAERMLADPEWGNESDRELGRRCGVDHKTIAKLRAGMAPERPAKKRTVRRRRQVYEIKASPARAQLASLAGDVAIPSGEIPQMTDGERSRRTGKHKRKSAQPTSMKVSAGSARDERSVHQLDELCRQWDKVKIEAANFINLLDAAHPLARERFAKGTPLAAQVTSILRGLAGSAGTERPRAADAAET